MDAQMGNVPVRMKRMAFRLYWLLREQCGVDLKIAFRSLRGLPYYLRDLARFRSSYTGRFGLMPCLPDRYEEGGATKLEYFWQDLHVARMIFDAKPVKHVDIGSRLDGFVAHVASFRDIEIFDVRPITAQIPGITVRQADLMNPLEGMSGYCDSLSCLHALEHFGLGRYGDPVDPRGAERGLANMARLLKQDGVLYLSVPIGIDRVEFNAHRVFDPRVIIDLARENSLQPAAFAVIREGGQITNCSWDPAQIAELAALHYALGIFVFKKNISGADHAARA
jgi:SAM-dependent methyltransferase